MFASTLFYQSQLVCPFLVEISTKCSKEGGVSRRNGLTYHFTYTDASDEAKDLILKISPSISARLRAQRQ